MCIRDRRDAAVADPSRNHDNSSPTGKVARAPGVHGAGPALDEPLVNDLLALLAAEETDFTLWFRCLANLPLADDCADDVLLATMAPAAYAALSAGHRAAVLGWLRRYAARARTEPPEERAARMAAVNPVFILRNYLVHQAIEQAEKSDPARPDTSFIERLLRAARAPYHLSLIHISEPTRPY